MSMYGGWISAFLVVGIFASPAGAIGRVRFETRQRDSSEWPKVAACYPDLPTPQIVITDVRQRPPWIDYFFMLANWEDYPPDLFAPAPHLSPCGLNESSSRTWVEIFVDGSLDGGFCALSQSYLQELEMGSSVSSCLSVVEVLLHDRECGIVYRSGPIPLPCPTDVAPVSWSTIKVLFR